MITTTTCVVKLRFFVNILSTLNFYQKILLQAIKKFNKLKIFKCCKIIALNTYEGFYASVSFKDWLPSYDFLSRFFHLPWIYKYIHKKHHEWIAPISLAASYAHPVEHLVKLALIYYLAQVYFTLKNSANILNI